jgi:hypothetical protein
MPIKRLQFSFYLKPIKSQEIKMVNYIYYEAIRNHEILHITKQLKAPKTGAKFKIEILKFIHMI